MKLITSQMWYIINFITTINKNIIKVNNNKLANKRSKALSDHYPYECAWCIRKAKLHDKPLIQTFTGIKAVFHSSPGLIRVWWYPLLRSIFENILVAVSFSFCSKCFSFPLATNIYTIPLLSLSLTNLNKVRKLLHSLVEDLGTFSSLHVNGGCRGSTLFNQHRTVLYVLYEFYFHLL